MCFVFSVFSQQLQLILASYDFRLFAERSLLLGLLETPGPRLAGRQADRAIGQTGQVRRALSRKMLFQVTRTYLGYLFSRVQECVT